MVNVIIDVEVLVLGCTEIGWQPRHAFCHTLVGGAVVGLLWGMAAYPIRRWSIRIMHKLQIPYEPSFRKMIASGVLGAWLHVLIDGLYHFDAKIFWPNKLFSIRRLIYRCSTYIGINRVYRHEIVQEQILVVTIGFCLASVVAYLLVRKTFGRNMTSGFLKSCIGRRRFWLLSVGILTALYGVYLYYRFPEGRITETYDTPVDESPLSESLTVTKYEAIADKDLLGCWRFNAGCGTTALDFSGNGNTGSIAGASWAPRAAGYTLDFDGIDDFVKVVSDPSIDNLEAITLAAWIYPRTDTHWHVLDKGDGDKRIYAEGIKQRLCGRVRYTGTHAYSESVSNTIMLDKWQHVALTWSKVTNTTRIFINGIEVKYSIQDVGSGIVLDDAMYPYTIGARGALGDSTFFHGRIDDVYVNRRALSPKEIAALYNWFTPGSYAQSGTDEGTLLK